MKTFLNVGIELNSEGGFFAARASVVVPYAFENQLSKAVLVETEYCHSRDERRAISYALNELAVKIGSRSPDGK
jgi:hypothetical protein